MCIDFFASGPNLADHFSQFFLLGGAHSTALEEEYERLHARIVYGLFHPGHELLERNARRAAKREHVVHGCFRDSSGQAKHGNDRLAGSLAWLRLFAWFCLLILLLCKCSL